MTSVTTKAAGGELGTESQSIAHGGNSQEDSQKQKN